MKRLGAVAAIVGLTLPILSAYAQAADLILLEGNALNAVMDELGPQFEKATGNKIVATLGTSAQIKSKIESGEAFDAVLMAKGTLEELTKAGKFAASPQAAIAKAGIGVAIRKGAPKLDLSTVDAFKQAMLNAKTIGFVDNTPTGNALKAIFAKLGIADQVNPKLKPLTIQAAVAVTNGDVEIAMTQISEILPYPGVELAGPLPLDIQSYTTFSAGVSANAKNAEAAASLIKFLTDPAAVTVIKAKGMEPG
jgi:molybdate transport system substrate-binding protein